VTAGEVPLEGAEGWFLDPYGDHEERWFSDGHPTSLVKDGAVESRDDPPDRSIDGPLQRVPSAMRPRADDLRRADDAGSGEPDYGRRAADVFDETEQ
jgi:hypothetical protein